MHGKQVHRVLEGGQDHRATVTFKEQAASLDLPANSSFTEGASTSAS